MTDVSAEITGSVWKIVVGVGDAVREDDIILVLESMKMEIPITAPEAGTVAEILVSEGETVPEGAVVARLNGGGARA
jgi:acetyl-CoA carboxylase biotin carboxyl carrier protein